ncbi:hypothetical protein MIND_00619400 [Mycena indigotica]|uniref:DUF6534 domain-containing protein n=1 Tax=Mycena indigotica TaxID=2126181 RepID=A0A8H6SRJ3_9AGAR|nr:uncharacterized protein MIND_00619400 [Mycena indigotica]KAF7303893.1 hypothetical protein MIND_00619400 [Mycena indigotica]
MAGIPRLNVDETLGAAFIGFAFSCAAMGVCTNQAVTYFTRFPEDKPRYKLLVVAVWILCAVDQSFIGHAVYFYTITNYANPVVLLERVAWTLILQLTLGAVIGTLVRITFAVRVWRFSQRNNFVTALILLLTVAELALAIVFTVKCFQNPFLNVLPRLKLMASLALGVGALTDVVIAVALCYFLRQYRTGSKRADNLVTILTVYAINTGAFTAGFGIITLVFYDLRPDNMQFLAFFFVLSKLYAISFYCTLNTRRSIRGKGTDGSAARSGATRVTISIPGRSAGNGNPRTTKGTTGTVVYGYPTSAMGTSSDAPASAFGRAGGRRSPGPALEVGVNQEVSTVSDLDETGLDVKAHDDYEYGYPDSSKRYSQSQSSQHNRDDKDELELAHRNVASSVAGSATFALPYAYSPPTSPAYAHSLESGSGYGWGSAGERGRKGVYAYGHGRKERNAEAQ